MSAYQTQGFKLDNSGKRVVVDPICRIEGHLRIEVNLDADNVIRNAVSTGTTPVCIIPLCAQLQTPSGKMPRRRASSASLNVTA
jgi:hypothetical protein